MRIISDCKTDDLKGDVEALIVRAPSSRKGIVRTKYLETLFIL